MKTITVIMLCLGAIICKATGDKDYTSARHYALGGASTTLIGGTASLENLGTLGLVDTMSVSIYYGNRFFVEGLSTYGIGAVTPMKSGVLGLSVTRFGNANYSQNNIGLGFGKVLTDKFSFGVKLNYQRIQQFEYGNKGLVTAEVGMLLKVSNQLTLGTHIYNPFSSRLTTESGTVFRSESGLRVGANYHLDEVKMLLEVESNTVTGIIMKLALEYEATEALFVRAGFAYPQKQASVGLGLNLGNFKTDIYYQYHFLLSSSSGISVSYEF